MGLNWIMEVVVQFLSTNTENNVAYEYLTDACNIFNTCQVSKEKHKGLVFIRCARISIRDNREISFFF